MGAAVGALTGLVSGQMQGESDQAGYRENIREYQRAAVDAEFDVADSLRRGAVEVGRKRQEGSLLAAQQRVAYSNSGVDATVGTAANVQTATHALSELDANTIANNAAREAWGHKQTAAKYRRQQESETKRMGSARDAQTVAMFSSVIQLGAEGVSLGLAGAAGGVAGAGAEAAKPPKKEPKK